MTQFSTYQMLEGKQDSIFILSYAVKCLTVILILVFGAATAINFIQPISGLLKMIPREYNEGWNAFLAVAAISNSQLYPDPLALTANVYSPLSFYIIGALGQIFGDNIIAGRMLAFISVLIVSINIILISRRLGASILIAVLCGLMFLGYVTAQYDSYIAMDDPQWLAHVFMTAGLLVFLYGNGRIAWLVTSILLMFAGGMIKQSIIALPLAIAFWLLIYDRRSFYVFALIGSALFIVSMTVCYMAYGAPFFTAVFTTSRVFSWRQAAGDFMQLCAPLGLLLIIPIILPLVDKRSEVKLLLIYVIASAASGAVILGAPSADKNAVFDFVIGLSITAALTLQALAERTTIRSLAVQICLMAAFSYAVLQATPKVVGKTRAYLENLPSFSATSKADIQYLAQLPGPAMCEDLALCYWAGKAFEVDFFFTGQKLLLGKSASTR